MIALLTWLDNVVTDQLATCVAQSALNHDGLLVGLWTNSKSIACLFVGVAIPWVPLFAPFVLLFIIAYATQNHDKKGDGND